MLWDCITSEEEGNGELKGGGENFFAFGQDERQQKLQNDAANRICGFLDFCVPRDFEQL